MANCGGGGHTHFQKFWVTFVFSLFWTGKLPNRCPKHGVGVKANFVKSLKENCFSLSGWLPLATKIPVFTHQQQHSFSVHTAPTVLNTAAIVNIQKLKVSHIGQSLPATWDFGFFCFESPQFLKQSILVDRNQRDRRNWGSNWGWPS